MFSARRAEVSHAARGNAEASGDVGMKSYAARRAGGAERRTRSFATGSGAARGARRDAGARALACGEPALGDEFGVRLANGVTGHAQVHGERAVRRQPGARGQPAGPDGVAQGGHQLLTARSPPAQLQMEIGPRGLTLRLRSGLSLRLDLSLRFGLKVRLRPTGGGPGRARVIDPSIQHGNAPYTRSIRLPASRS
ncbi:hypothetical protein GCM10011583_59900 [Streptomyces camponoticapitis]|uniref:Uncharacterized protein n=1 Tax=Streptomyces camponoticapitis TaxID=1616125 RepID=A0ABQ2ESI3_9ACTN|nr:hypothetical protein GCM10011583_59900 [Streptomyces camponoticapitis]